MKIICRNYQNNTINVYEHNSIDEASEDFYNIEAFIEARGKTIIVIDENHFSVLESGDEYELNED